MLMPSLLRSPKTVACSKPGIVIGKSMCANSPSPGRVAGGEVALFAVLGEWRVELRRQDRLDPLALV